MTVPAESTEGEDQGEQLPENFRRRLDQVQQDLRSTQGESQAKDSLIMDMAFQLAGVPIESGRGKTARQHYSGEPTREAILAYMKEGYEWEPAPTTQSAEVGQQIAEAQTRMQEVGFGAGSESGGSEKTLHQAIAEAEEKQDWKRSLQLKKQLAKEKFFGKGSES